MIDITIYPYVNEKYTKFFNKYGYIPKMFNAYNCSEITDFAPTQTTMCSRSGSSSSVLILEDEDE